MTYAKKHHKDIISVDPLPSEQQLAEYYSQKYYQESDGAKTTYDSIYTAEELEYKKLESRMILQGVKEHAHTIKTSPAILDLGCGEGFLVQEGKDQGYDVTGIDFSSFSVRKWNPSILEKCKFGNIYDFLKECHETKKGYDVCVLRNVLEHVINPPALLKQISGILNDDGIALITVPNDYSDLQKLAMDRRHIDREFWFAPPDHLHYFNTKNIIPFFEENGYYTIDMFSSFPVDFFLYHSGSNYIADKSKGKEAHFARIAIDLLLAKSGMDKFLNLYRAMAACGIGRDFTTVIKKK